MWWVQPWSRTDVSVCCRQLASVPSGSRSSSQSGNGRSAPQVVARPVVLAEVPVEVPDVVPPADDLADEALHGGDRRMPLRVRVLRRPHHLQRIQQSEVQRRRQQRVRHPAVAAQHGVLVRPEGRQPVRGRSAPSAASGLGPGGGERAGAVGADEPDPVGRPAIQVGPDLLVDLVLGRPPRLGSPRAGPRPSVGVPGCRRRSSTCPVTGSAPSISTSSRRRASR